MKKCLADEGENCSTPGIIYEARCIDCPDDNQDIPFRYIGTSGQNLHACSVCHANDIKYRKPTNSLHKHNKIHHIDTLTNSDRFRFKKVKTVSDNIARLLTESHTIYHAPDKLMNSKGEYSASKWVSVDFRSNGT